MTAVCVSVISAVKCRHCMRKQVRNLKLEIITKFKKRKKCKWIFTVQLPILFVGYENNTKYFNFCIFIRETIF